MELDSIHLALAEQLLLSIKREGKKALITYGELCKKSGDVVTPRNSAGYIGDLSIICYENDMPLISVMVVNGEKYEPGPGFFKLYSDLTSTVVNEDNRRKVFKEELQKVREYNHWGEFAKILGIQIEFEEIQLQNQKIKSKTYEEGKIVLRQHLERERNPEVIKAAKKLFWHNNGKFFCEICGFDFERFYGVIGRGMIEGHHMKPVSKMVEGNKTKIEDIKMVCANCHRVIHKNMSMNLEDIKKCLNANYMIK